jgi:hypothetical protein
LCTLSTCKLCTPKSSSVWREALASSYSPWCWCSVGESFFCRMKLICWDCICFCNRVAKRMLYICSILAKLGVKANR